jgi:hypothetical protein
MKEELECFAIHDPREATLSRIAAKERKIAKNREAGRE